VVGPRDPEEDQADAHKKADERTESINHPWLSRDVPGPFFGREARDFRAAHFEYPFTRLRSP
jgi:hypothetical protein